MPFPIAAIAVLFVGICIALDLRTRRIPNAVNGAAMVLGLLLNGLYVGRAGVLASLAGLVLPIAVLLLPFALGGIGGGDVKMMGALGSLLGPRLALWGLALGMILGGGLMIVHLGRVGRLREKLRATGTMIHAAAMTGTVAPLRVDAGAADAVTLPYSVPLGIGSLVALAAAGSWR